MLSFGEATGVDFPRFLPWGAAPGGSGEQQSWHREQHSLTLECHGGPGGNSDTSATQAHRGCDVLGIFLHQEDALHLSIKTALLAFTRFSLHDEGQDLGLTLSQGCFACISKAFPGPSEQLQSRGSEAEESGWILLPLNPTRYLGKRHQNRFESHVLRSSSGMMN